MSMAIVNVFPDEEPDGPFFVRPVPPKGWYFVYLTGVDAEGLPVYTPRIGVFENFIKAENAARLIAGARVFTRGNAEWYTTFHQDGTTAEPFIDRWTCIRSEYHIWTSAPTRLDCGLTRVTFAGHWQDLIPLERGVAALGGEAVQPALHGGALIAYFRSELDLNLLKAQFRNNYGFWTVHA